MWLVRNLEGVDLFILLLSPADSWHLKSQLTNIIFVVSVKGTFHDRWESDFAESQMWIEYASQLI